MNNYKDSAKQLQIYYHNDLKNCLQNVTYEIKYFVEIRNIFF